MAKRVELLRILGSFCRGIEQRQAAGASGEGGEGQALQFRRRDESQVRHLVMVRAEDAQVLDPVGAAVAPRDDVMGLDEDVETAEEAFPAQLLAGAVARGMEVVRAGPLLRFPRLFGAKRWMNRQAFEQYLALAARYLATWNVFPQPWHTTAARPARYACGFSLTSREWTRLAQAREQK